MEQYGDQTRIKKIRLILVLILIAALVIAGIIILTKNARKLPTRTIEKLQVLPGNPETNAIYTSKDYSIFSNGRQLIKYNYATGETVSLSKTVFMPEIQDVIVSPNGRLIAIRSVDDGPFDSYDYPPEYESISGWRLLNTESGRFTYLFVGTSYVSWKDNDTLVYSQENELREYKITGPSNTLLHSHSKPIASLKSYDDSVYFVDAEKILKYDTPNKKVEEAYPFAVNAIFGNKAGCFVAQKAEDFSDETESIVVGCGAKEFRIGNSKDNAESITFTEDGQYVLFFLGSTLHYAELSSGKIGDILLKGSDFTDAALLGANDLESLFFQRNRYQVFTNGPAASYKRIDDSKPVLASGLTIDPSPEKQAFSVSKSRDFTKAERSRVFAKIKETGYNLDLFNVNFEVLPPDDYRW